MITFFLCHPDASNSLATFLASRLLVFVFLIDSVKVIRLFGAYKTTCL